jgi:hypothetical protein
MGGGDAIGTADDGWGVSPRSAGREDQSNATVDDVEPLVVLVDAGERAKDLDRPGTLSVRKYTQGVRVFMTASNPEDELFYVTAP